MPLVLHEFALRGRADNAEIELPLILPCFARDRARTYALQRERHVEPGGIGPVVRLVGSDGRVFRREDRMAERDADAVTLAVEVSRREEQRVEGRRGEIRQPLRQARLRAREPRGLQPVRVVAVCIGNVRKQIVLDLKGQKLAVTARIGLRQGLPGRETGNQKTEEDSLSGSRNAHKREIPQKHG